MRRNLLLILALFFINQINILAQPWPNATWTGSGACAGDEPEILKAYIDACFGPEQQNEFVYMKTGANGWNYSNFTMEGGSSQPNPLSVASNFQPASVAIINNLNAGVGTCGAGTTFFAGTNPLPPNATVMVYPCGFGTSVPANLINYMCGKGPIYVIAGNFNPAAPPAPPVQAFFRNGTGAGGGPKVSKFNFGTCQKVLTYNNTSPSQFPNDQGSNNVGAYALGPGQSGMVGTSACFEAQPCVGPPNPDISNPTIQICESAFIPAGSIFNCGNCTTGNISVYSSASALTPIYVGPSFPPSGFFPPNVTTTYYLEQSGFCPSGKTAVTLQVNPAPQNLPNVPATLTCANPTITITGSISTGPNFTYNWSGPGGFTSNVAFPTLSAVSTPPAVGGDYFLTVTNTTTGCTKTVQFPVAVNAAFPQVTPSPDKTITCNTPIVSIGSNSTTPGATYAWSNGASTGTQVVSAAGTYILSVTNPASGCVKKDTVIVTKDDTPPIISPIPAVTVNCTTLTPSLVASASGGTGLTYAWSGGNNPSSATNTITTGGTYTVTVTNPSNGCKSSLPITVTENKTIPDAVIAPPAVLNCTNMSSIPIVSTGTSTGANFTYTWTAPPGVPDYPSTALTPPNATLLGTYSLTVTNTTNGCTKVASVTVTENKTLPTADAGADKILNCTNNQSVSIGTTAIAGMNYLWSNTIATATQTVTTAATYTVTVTNPINGCTKIDDVTVTLDNVAPVITPIPAVTVNCFTPSPTLVTNVTGSNLVYTWTPASVTGANPSITAGGTYTVTVTNSVNGCKDTKTIVVPEDKNDPTAVIAPPAVLNCTNMSSIVLNPTGTSTGANITYNWTAPTGVVGYPATTFTPPNATLIGTYSLSVTNTTNGCTKTTSVSVTENKTLPTADAGAGKILNCTNGQSVSIGTAAIAGMNYLWSNAIATATQTVTAAGTYTVTVTDPINGCAKTDDVTVTLDNVAPVISPIPAVTVNCFTPNPTLTTSVTGSNLVYVWSPSGSGANPSITTGGTYTVTVTNSVNGCTDTETITVTENKVDPAAVIAPPAVLTCTNNSSIVLNTTGTSTGANITYNWTAPAGATGFPSTALPPPNATVAGPYNLTVTNTTNGCTKTASVTVTENKTLPTADAGTDKLLSCLNNQSVSIGTTAIAGLTYSWSNSISTATQTVTTAATYTLTVTNPVNGCTKVDDVVVTADITPPVISPIAPVTVNCFTPNPSLTTSVTGPNLVYTWSPSGSGANPTITTGGTYTLTVTNSVNGCTDTKTVVIPEDKVVPNAVISLSANLSCLNNSSITLNTLGTSTGPNYTYSWTGFSPGYPSTTLTPPTVTTPGQYSLTVTNTTNGCTKTASLPVSQNIAPPILANMSPQVLTCTNNGQVTIGGAATGGTNFTYNWSNSQTTATQTVTAPGTFTVTVTNTDNGCTATSSVVITEDKVIPTVNAGADLSINCNNPTVSANATASGGTTLTYAWSGGSAGTNTLTPTFNAAGTYTLTVTNTVNGCTKTDDIVVTADLVQPTAVIAPLTLNCTAPTANLNTTGTSTGANYTYNWSGPSGFANTTLSPNITLSGTYVLTVTNTTNGCTKTATINVTEDKFAPTANITTAPLLTCANPTTQINATGSTGANFTYAWTSNVVTGSSTLTPTVNTAGSYTLTVTNTTNGCTQTATTNVTEDKVAPVVTATGTGNITCLTTTANLGVTITSGSNLVFQWGPSTGIVGNSTLQNITVNQGGTYIVTVTNTATGCSATSPITITSNNTPPTANAVVSGAINCNNTSATLDGTSSTSGANITYLWTGPGLNSSTTLTPTVNAGGAYTLALTNTTNGCTNSKTVVVNEDKVLPVGSIFPPSQLTCTAPTVTITVSSNPTYLYSWSASAGGNIVSGGSTQSIVADKVGTYSVNIINAGNGCQITLPVNVTENKQFPTVVTVPNAAISCIAPNVTLNANGSSSGFPYTISWTSSTASPITNATSLQPTVSSAATYTIKIVDSSNGCEKTGTVVVTDNKVLPIVQVAQGGTIDCNNPAITLNGNGSSTGVNYTYNWTSGNGLGILSGSNTLIPTVTQGNTYTLVVTDITNSCTDSKQVIVQQNTTKPSANAGPPKVITCASNSIQLQGSGSTGNQYQYQWSNSGGNISNAVGGNTLTPTVSQVGTYTLVVKDVTNGCTESATTTVTLDQGVPTANAGAKKEINCNVLQVTLDGSASTPGLTYNWTTIGGNIVSGNGTLTPLVDKPGTYNLEVFNTANGCKGNASVQVDDQRIKPTLKIAKPKTLNCANTSFVLDGTGSSTGANFVYNWTTTGGNIVGSPTIISPTIDKAGSYNFNIKNNTNGCSKDSTVVVTENFNKPVPAAAAPALLTCTQPTTVLDATASTKIQNAKVQWKSSIPNGLTLGTNPLKLTVNDEGKFTLILTDTLSFCKDSIVIDVKKDANIPQANAGTAGELNCTTKELTLNATASTGTNITYSWTTVGGNFVGGVTNTLTPKVNAPGKYTLKVLNSTNQCTKESSIDIVQDTLKPLAKIAKPAILNCKTTVTPIDASASSQGTNFSLAWTTPSGAVVSGANTASLLVNKPGVFAVTVTNTKNTCTASNTVTVKQDIVKPNATVSNNDTLNCRNASTKLKGVASSNSGFYTFEWKEPTAGAIIKDALLLTPTVNQPGNYQLIVTDTVNFCPSTAQITVIKDVQTPVVDAGTAGNLTCTVKDVALSGTASNGKASDFIYTWTTANGNIFGSTSTLNTKADAPGKYFLEVENKINGCKAKDSTSVTQDANVPKVEILASGNLDCKTKTLELDGSGSSQGAGITYKWSAKNGGVISSGANTLKVTISSAGDYTLQITNSNNNCIKEITKTISSDTLPPVITISQDILTCAKPTIELVGKVFQASQFTFDWQTSNGTIVSNKDSLQILVSKKGDYILNVKNTKNECVSSKKVTVLEDKTLPTTDAGLSFEINCQDSIITLKGDNSSKGIDYVYNWTTKTGNILKGEKTLTPDIDKAGVYVLSIFNKGNGCSNKDSVDIKINKTLPKISIAKPDTITCKKQQVNINATSTATGTAQFAWTSVASANIIGDKTKASIATNQPGSFNLVVIDDKNKCISKATVGVLQDTIKPIVSAGANIELNCKSPTIDITGTATAKQPLTYLWTTSNGGTIVANGDKAKVTVKTAGNYKLLVSNNFNGCTASDEMEVTFLGAPKAVVLKPETLTCTRTSVILDSKGSDIGANYTYTWTNNTGNNLGTNPTLTTATPGTYTLKVYNSSNECEKKQDIIVEQDIAKPNANAGSSAVIDCDKGFVILSAKNSSQGSKFKYQWSGGLIDSGANSIEAQVTAQAVYTLLVTNTENGCTASDTVGVLSLKPALLETVAKDPACYNQKGSITFKTISGGTPPYSYSIDGGKNYYAASSYNSLKPGEYFIHVQDSKGCEDSSSVTLNNPDKLTIDIPSINQVKIGEDIQLQASVDPSIPKLTLIKWSPDSMLSCKDCLAPILKKPLTNIYFTLKVVNENDCVAETFTTVEVDKRIGVYVPSKFSPNGDNINDRFIAFGDPDLVLRIKWFKIFDRWGDNVYSETDIKVNEVSRGWDGIFNNKDVNPGVFIWNCEVEFIDGTTKILKGDVTLTR